MISPLISIILPAFNAERFISNVVESILQQSLSDWELIIVDDGSCDMTPEICDEFMKNDSRIRVIHKKNGGVSSARNVGVENANGYFITFVDADDYMIPQYLDALCSSIEDADISMFPMTPVLSEKEIIAKQGQFKIGYSKYSLADGYIEASKKGLLHPPYCKCYRHELIKAHNLRFDESVSMGEDLLFNLAYLDYCKSVVIGNNSIYFYIKSNSILSKTISGNYADLQIEFYNRREQFCKRNNISYSLKPFQYSILFDAYSSILTAANLSRLEKKVALDRISNSELVSDYLKSSKSRSVREFLFRMVLRFPTLNNFFR